MLPKVKPVRLRSTFVTGVVVACLCSIGCSGKKDPPADPPQPEISATAKPNAQQTQRDRDELQRLIAKAEHESKPDQFDIEFAFVSFRNPSLPTSAIAGLLLAVYYRRDFVSLEEMLQEVKRIAVEDDTKRMYIRMTSLIEEMAKKDLGDPDEELEYRRMLRLTEMDGGRLTQDEIKLARDLLSRPGYNGAYAVGLLLLCKSNLTADDLREARGLMLEGARKHDSKIGKQFWPFVSEMVETRNSES